MGRDLPNSPAGGTRPKCHRCGNDAQRAPAPYRGNAHAPAAGKLFDRQELLLGDLRSGRKCNPICWSGPDTFKSIVQLSPLSAGAAARRKFLIRFGGHVTADRRGEHGHRRNRVSVRQNLTAFSGHQAKEIGSFRKLGVGMRHAYLVALRAIWDSTSCAIQFAMGKRAPADVSSKPVADRLGLSNLMLSETYRRNKRTEMMG